MSKKYAIKFQYAGLTNISNNPTVKTIDGKQVGYVRQGPHAAAYDDLNTAYFELDYFVDYFERQGKFKDHTPTYTVEEYIAQ